MSPYPNIHERFSLRQQNTLGFNCLAERYTETHNEEDIESVISLAKRNNWQVHVLGGGSNVVLRDTLPGITIRHASDKLSFKQIDGNREVLVRADAGCNWNNLVLACVDQNLPGIENLTLIPGDVGASPVQNIGAYGVELCERFESCRAFHIPTRQWIEFDTKDCEFAYRDSYFKKKRGEYLISQVTLRVGHHYALVTDYTDVRSYLAEHDISQPTVRNVSDAVAAIRSSKLPDPKQLGNAGSFFHNPIVSTDHAQRLLARFPQMVTYTVDKNRTKLAAGWLIDYLGFKGYRDNGVGVHKQQALVLVHHGGANGDNLLALASDIQRQVEDTFGVRLSVEPQIWPKT